MVRMGVWLSRRRMDMKNCMSGSSRLTPRATCCSTRRSLWRSVGVGFKPRRRYHKERAKDETTPQWVYTGCTFMWIYVV
eukprot:654154-Amphidinium_carterae.2